MQSSTVVIRHPPTEDKVVSDQTEHRCVSKRITVISHVTCLSASTGYLMCSLTSKTHLCITEVLVHEHTAPQCSTTSSTTNFIGRNLIARQRAYLTVTVYSSVGTQLLQFVFNLSTIKCLWISTSEQYSETALFSLPNRRNPWDRIHPREPIETVLTSFA